MKPTVTALSLFFLFLISLKSFSQDAVPSLISDDDWQAIIPHLISEDWPGVEKMSTDYLKRFANGKEMLDEAGIVRYMYLCSIGGQLGDKNITKEVALKKVRDLKGKNIVTPFCSYKTKGLFNYLSIDETGKTWTKCFSNNAATTIYIFENFEMNDKELLETKNSAALDGKSFRLSAVIKEISADGYTMPRLKILYSDTEIWDEGNDE